MHGTDCTTPNTSTLYKSYTDIYTDWGQHGIKLTPSCRPIQWLPELKGMLSFYNS